MASYSCPHLFLLDLSFHQIRKISGTGKAMARAEKYEMKRSVEYEQETICLVAWLLLLLCLPSPLFSAPTSPPLLSPSLSPFLSSLISNSTPQQYSTAADFTLEGSGKKKRKQREEGEEEVKQEPAEGGQ